MAKNYIFQFGVGSPTLMTGLSPTFVVFKNIGGSLLTAPGVTEIPTSTGLYYATYGATQAVAFVLDGGSGAGTNRFITGALDPIQAVDESVGLTTSSYGGTASDPTTLYGYLRRLQEFNEGNSTFTKTTGTWDIYSRGSSTLLTEKILTNSTSTTTKT